MTAHTAFGRNAGLTEESVDALITIDSEVLDAREVTALVWVRSFLQSPEGVPVEVEERFRAAFTEDEQVYVKAAMKGMFCTNLLVNTARHLSVRLTGRGVELNCCPLPGPSDG